MGIPVMNSIFAAKNLDIPIDVFIVSTHTSLQLLEQAAHLSTGIFVRAKPATLLQQFLYLFLPTLKTRRTLNMVDQKDVDLRATCFCHRRPCDMGYVCGACLSVFCEKKPTCASCG